MPPRSQGDDDAVEVELASLTGLSTGLLSATEGAYNPEQFLLDVTQGARVEYGSYHPQAPPPLAFQRIAAGAQLRGWDAVLRRARGAPQILLPGLLAASVPGGAAYVHIVATPPSDAVMVAARDGTIAAASEGSRATLLARIASALATHSLVVADLADGPEGSQQLGRLAAQRPARQLLLVVQRAPDGPGHELLWMATGGLAPGRALTSASTQQPDLVAAVDLPVTILRWLGRPVPAAMRGRPLSVDGRFDAGYARGLARRLQVVYGRRIPALWWLLATWTALIAVLTALRRTRLALRVVGLSALWVPAATLIPAGVEPGREAEKALIVAAALGLGALTERILPWPRGPLVPAVVTLGTVTVDALAHTQLLIRSVLGPNPAFGARFYGIGNELKSGLVVLAFAGVAALLTPAQRSRRSALAMAGTGTALGVIEGSARIGAGVGGVILVAAGTAVATILLWPGSLHRRRILIVLASPLVALVALAALDLATAHGGGHFSGSILHARSPGDLRDVVVRRYRDAWGASRNGLMPVAFGLSLLATAGALRWRRELYAPVSDPVWRAALAGGLAAGIVGALTEDSGTVLFVVAVGVLGAVSAYLLGAPTRSGLSRRVATTAARPPPPLRPAGAERAG
jgi:hypothetical protein